MLIYFDAKDLINIFEKSIHCSADELKQILQQGGHQLVYSLTNINEISQPLKYGDAKTNVTSLLQRLEEVPHTYMHSGILSLELDHAAKAYKNGEEYENIHPYVNRFDDTVDFNARPPTKIFLNYSLPEIVWTLQTYGGVDGLYKYTNKLKQAFGSDRAMSPRPSLKESFSATIERDLRLYGVATPTGGVESFANWIFSNPARCPSLRLGFEVWHKIARNITDDPTPSDLADLVQINCLPYVDLLTLDRRMRGYVSQACKTLGTIYSTKVCKNSREIIDSLLKQKG